MSDVMIRPKRVVAIDGPAASGKSTTAAAVAKALGFVHLNSGLLYRAFTWRALRESWDPGAPDFGDRVRATEIELARDDRGLHVVIEGETPGPALRGQEVAGLVSEIASLAAVRDEVLVRLRSAGERFDLVCDGRDIGTTVFPSADLKIFLVAEGRERARRRLRDLGVTPDAAEVEAEAERLARRDEADATRALSPLQKATDAVEIDTTSLRPDEVVDRICALARSRGIEAVGPDD